MKNFSKILKPFENIRKKKKEYVDISKESKKVPDTLPSKLLIQAVNLAGNTIQRKMNMLSDCRWVRPQYTYPAFDHINFSYKNAVFSVLVDIQDNSGKSYLPEEYIKRQLYAAKVYNLIPCKFVAITDNVHDYDFASFQVKNDGWNLYNSESGELVVPEEISAEEDIKMSEWEIRSYCIQYVIRYIKSMGYRLQSFQDTLEVDPQIWFENKNGKRAWILLRSVLSSDEEVKKPEKMQEIIKRCFKYDGYFVGVLVEPKLEGQELYRGNEIKISFSCYEKIHTVM